MFSWYKYLIVNLVFSHLGFWSGNLFLIAPFPDLCLLVLFSIGQRPMEKGSLAWCCCYRSDIAALKVVSISVLHFIICCVMLHQSLL